MEIDAVAQFVLYCLTIAGLTMFIQECFGSGMILRRYYLLLNLLWIRWRSKKLRKYRGILKPLGLCSYCQGFWINTILQPIFYKLDIYYILSIGGVYISLELIYLLKKWTQ